MTTREGPAAFLPSTLAVSVVARQCPGGVPALLPASWRGPRHQPLGKVGAPPPRGCVEWGPLRSAFYHHCPSSVQESHGACSPCTSAVSGRRSERKPSCFNETGVRSESLAYWRAGWLVPCSPLALTFSAVLSCSRNPRASPISTCTCALLFS